MDDGFSLNAVVRELFIDLQLLASKHELLKLDRNLFLVQYRFLEGFECGSWLDLVFNSLVWPISDMNNSVLNAHHDE